MRATPAGEVGMALPAACMATPIADQSVRRFHNVKQLRRARNSREIAAKRVKLIL